MKFKQLFITFVAIALVALTAAAHAADTGTSPCASQPVLTTLTTLTLGEIFTYFMVMLGPIKLVGPFVKITKGMDDSASRKLAVKGFAIACLAGLIAAVIGRNTLESWGVSLPALLIAAGLILLLVALQTVLSQYEQRPAATVEILEPAATASKLLALSPLAFPNIITPYGTAVLILLLAAAPPGQSFGIFGVFLVIMLINLVAMFFAKPILKYGAGFLTVLGYVFGVLQVALAVQMLLLACRMLGLLPQMES